MISKTFLLAPPMQLLVLASSLAACSGQRLSLGDNADDSATSNLCNGGTVTDNVTAKHQDQIDALLGCEVIEGDLHILAREDEEPLNLAPLSSLRLVRGQLRIEHVSSLEGLEALEQVGLLLLNQLYSTDLSGLSGLERVGGDLPNYGVSGIIDIRENPYLQSLAGLERLKMWSNLNVDDNPVLVTLEGLSGPPTLRDVNIWNLPALHDLSGLDFAYEANQVNITNTGLESLDGFSALTRAQSVVLERNAALVSLSGLLHLSSVDYLQVNDNDSLITADLPDLEQAQAIRITHNDALQYVASYHSRGESGFVVGDLESNASLFVSSRDVYEVGGNAQLVTIHGPDGFRDVRQVSIWGNPALTNLTLNHLERANGLQIRDNATLKRVIVPQLQRVGDLEVVNNPALSTADFADVPTFSSNMSGNADVPAAPAP